MLVFVAAGASLVNARFGGAAVPYGAQMARTGAHGRGGDLVHGGGLGRHLNPGVSLAFAIRGDFPWRRLPATSSSSSWARPSPPWCWSPSLASMAPPGSPLPGSRRQHHDAMLWEMILTAGLVSVVLGTASGAQNLGSLGAIAVASYIALAGLIGARSAARR